MEPREFRIDVPDSVLQDLRERLKRTRWPDAIPDTGWEYGADVSYIQELCSYWADGYDWRRHEAELNRYPQYVATVDGVDIHFWHVRGKGPRPLPLMLIHGWPGSIYEFHHLLAPLSDPAAHGGSPDDAFDVVVPALPGYGFSGKPRERGWNPLRIARAFHALMRDVLGYERWGLQGGDWGAIVSTKMAEQFPSEIVGLHLNFVVVPAPANPTPEDEEVLRQRAVWDALETGYSRIQGTKPMSLAVAQADSPAGLAAWIVEKFRTWSDCEGDVERKFGKDTLLTNLMFYWAPNSVASAARLYYEAFRDRSSILPASRIEVPTAVAAFPKEPWRAPRRWVEPYFRLVRWTEMPRGGHFAALEEPQLLLDDLRAFFRPLRSG